MGSLNFLAIARNNGQTYIFFFDDATPDRQLKAIWKDHVRDKELDFSRKDYRLLCRRLRDHHKRLEQGTTDGDVS